LKSNLKLDSNIRTVAEGFAGDPEGVELRSTHFTCKSHSIKSDWIKVSNQQSIYKVCRWWGGWHE